MSRRLWVTAIVIFVAVAAIIALAFVSSIEQAPALAVIVLVCVALAIVALQYLVVAPAQLESAKKSARTYCEAGQIIDPSLHRRLCDRLARAPDDPEAVRLHQKLNELQPKK
jgi:steroid 5-alpha reductase family enzyme